MIPITVSKCTIFIHDLWCVTYSANMLSSIYLVYIKQETIQFRCNNDELTRNDHHSKIYQDVYEHCRLCALCL